jgi:acetyl-CoA carboxylase biotin carboxyl carrier protein
MNEQLDGDERAVEVPAVLDAFDAEGSGAFGGETGSPALAGLPAGAPAAEAAAADSPEDVPSPPVDGADASLLALIDRLSSLLDRSDLTELEVQVGATGLVLRKPQAIAPQPVPVGGTGAGGAATEAAGAGAGSGTAAAGAGTDGPPARPAVMAPLSGIWYGSPAPGSAPYVNVGGEVAVGQVIGLIEAMKLFNEIKSDLAGRVVKITAENGKLVRAKQPLIEVEPL